MHRSLCTVALISTVLASALAAQKTCFVANQDQAQQGTFLNTAQTVFALKENTGANPVVVTAVDFYLKTFGTATTTTVSIWDENPASGRPGTLLASGSVTLVLNVEGWYGALLTPAVNLPANTNFFVGVDLNGAIRPMLVNNGPGVRSTPHWFSPPTWNGPFASAGWKYRVYCGTHRGVYASYGTGKQGTGGAVPLLLGQGRPNTGNLISLNLNRALHGTTAILVWGARNDLPVSIGQLYVFPIVLTTFGTTAGTAAGNGFLLTDVTIPVDASLAGAKVAFQSWVVDAGAIASVSHSNGVEATIGH